MATYQCRIEGCTEQYSEYGRLFLHESKHPESVPTASGDLYRDKYNDPACIVTKIRADGMCQFPHCTRSTRDDPRDEESRKMECHHFQQINHPNYMALLCSECHGLVTGEQLTLHRGPTVQPISKLGRLIPADEDRIPTEWDR